MPHMSLGGSEDFYSTDEVKVYKDEGNKDEEKRSSENLTEEKLGLVTESEEGKNSLQGNFASSEKSNNGVSDDDKSSSGPPAPEPGPPGPLEFFLPSYASPYANGSSMAGKFSLVQPHYPGLVMYNEFAQPPPAHKGYSPVYHDPKTGLPRPPVYAAYPAPHGQFPHPLYSPEFTSASWHRPGYPLTSGAFAGSFPPSLSSLSRYGHPGLLTHPGLVHSGIPHPASLGPGPKSELMSPQLLQDSHSNASGHSTEPQQKKKNHIKKPLNAFMLFMKEQRPKVIAECTLRESSAINQILGRRWHALDRAEQAKYYEMARKEKELHLQLYPGWSARDNYAAHQKKKKRKKDGGGDGNNISGMGSSGAESPMSGCSGMGGDGPLPGPCGDSENKPGECSSEKRCRARYGMEQQSRWCKPCRRKKKCIRYRQDCEEDDKEVEDSLLRDQSMDSSFMSGCESDCKNPVSSPDLVTHGKHPQHSSNVASGKDVVASQISPIKAEAFQSEEPDIRLFQPSPLRLVSSGVSKPVPTSSPLPPLRHLTPHTIDSFLFAPSTVYMPYHLPPSPLALPMSYIGFTPSHYQPSSPRTYVMPTGSPLSFDMKPAFLPITDATWALRNGQQ